MRLTNVTTEVSEASETMREFAGRLQHYAAIFDQYGNTPEEEDVNKAIAMIDHYSSELNLGLLEVQADGLFGYPQTREEEDNHYRR